mgnify:FL=1|tara:strand:+ start:99 stop:392 length:294 start_codon:yes stop_codon:yes gene_type:complete
MTFYNTTQQTGEELKTSWIDTAKQDEIILLLFARNQDMTFTPFDIQNILKHDYDKDYPITSIRRSISNLTEIEALEKTSTKRKGKYGKKNYCWKYAL